MLSHSYYPQNAKSHSEVKPTLFNSALLKGLSSPDRSLRAPCISQRPRSLPTMPIMIMTPAGFSLLLSFLFLSSSQISTKPNPHFQVYPSRWSPPFPFPRRLLSPPTAIFIPPQRRIKGTIGATCCFLKWVRKKLKFVTHCTEINQIPALGRQLKPGESAPGRVGRKMSMVSVLQPHRKILTTLGNWSPFQYLVTTKSRTPFTQRQQNTCSVKQSPPTFCSRLPVTHFHFL